MKEAFLSMFTCKDGSEYGVLTSGAVKHLNPVPFKYDQAYSGIYDTPEYQRNSELLQAMRYGFATAAHGNPIISLQDVGYGNGAFMAYAQRHTRLVYGKDVTGYPVPDGCTLSEEYEDVDVMTFHDCLEHFHNLEFVRNLPCRTLVVSLPNCPMAPDRLDWFENEYPHRKPSEHIYHFSESSLQVTMEALNWRRVATSYHESIIRNRGRRNILTMAFKRP